MTQLLVALGAIAGLFGLIWAAQTAARKRGEAEANLQSEQEGRKAEQDMSEAQGEVITQPELRDRIRKGTFGGQS
jgi:hypothetical protein